ncbi:MAG TPA: tyrosine-type recombinase/integrase [Candidatus Dormibacteraeota bacterium]|nr:tyrosine-type recombinase/integrase [Candidatus Dormibacteraeota bacterium]
MNKIKRMEHGNILKRGENKYLVRWRVKDQATGKSRQTAKTVLGDYGAALAFLSDTLKNPTPTVEIPKRTFGSYAATEWARYVEENWKASTQVTQGSFLRRHIVPFFESMLLADIRPANIEGFHAAMKAKGLGPKSRRLLHAILTKMFSYAVDDLELIDRNPVKKGLAPKVGPKREKPALTEAQLMQVFKDVPARMKAFFMVLGLTGIRSGEALGLHWSDLDFASCELHVRRAIYRGQETTPKTDDSIRARPMAPALYQALLNHKAMSAYVQPEDFVFASSTGRPFNPDTLREALHAALKGQGITFDQARADGMHLLRHSSGSMVYRHSGGDVKQTQEWLGHSNSRVTLDTYTHLASDQGKQTAQRLEQAVFAPPAKTGLMH